MNRRRQQRTDLDEQADAFVEAQGHRLAPPELTTRLSIDNRTIDDHEEINYQATQTPGPAVGRARRGRTPTEVILPAQKRSPKAIRLDQWASAARRYDEAQAEAEAAAATRLPTPRGSRALGIEKAHLRRLADELAAKHDYRALHAPMGDICVEGRGTHLPGEQHLQEVAVVARRLAEQALEALNSEWLVAHQYEIYLAAGRGAPYWTCISPHDRTPTLDEVIACDDRAEWKIANERRPDNPTAYLMEVCIPRTRAVARHDRIDVKAAVRNEKRRIRHLAADAADRSDPPLSSPPTCARCPNAAERHGTGWRSLCSACRKQKQRTGSDRPARLINTHNDRKR